MLDPATLLTSQYMLHAYAVASARVNSRDQSPVTNRLGLRMSSAVSAAPGLSCSGPGIDWIEPLPPISDTCKIQLRCR